MRALTLTLMVAAFLAGTVRAEHASIDLRVMRVDPQTGKERDEVSASVLQDPPGEIGGQRPEFKAKAGEPLVLQFIFKNTYPHGEKKDVRIRYFVVRETQPKQKSVPDLREGVVTQGRVGARQAFTIKEPGSYLLRLQSENTDSDHEHFSAIDILVEK